MNALVAKASMPIVVGIKTTLLRITVPNTSVQLAKFPRVESFEPVLKVISDGSSIL